MSQYLFIDGAYLRSNFEQQMESFYGEVPPIVFEAVASDLGGHRSYFL